MKYEVKVTQTYRRDGSDYDFTDNVKFVFADINDVHTFINLISLNSETLTVEIKFIKEEQQNVGI